MNTDICMGCFEPMNGFDVCSNCGWHRDAEPAHAYHLRQGTVLHGRYIIGNSVGVGGFGITYRAWDANLNSLVAIKEFYPAGLVSRVPGEKDIVVFSGDKKEQFDTNIKRFLEEARTMAKFTGHPNIVHVYDFFEENHTAYIVMEFLDGITVKQFQASVPDGKIEVPTAIEIVTHVLDALAEMHAKGIIHRDISPDNIQITANNEVKIFDLGAAKLAKEDKEETRSIVVKTGFTPPEQYRAKSKQAAYTDLYSVGAVLYKLVTGITPDESVDRVVEDNLEKPSKHGVELDGNLERTIMKALALKPELRFQNAAQFKDAISNKKEVDFPEEELKKRRKFRIVFASVLTAFTLVFFTVFGIYMNKFMTGVNYLQAQDETISVFLPVSIDPSVAAEQEKMYKKLADEFVAQAKSEDKQSDQRNNFKVELSFAPQNEYHAQLMEKINSGNAPTVFNTDFFGAELPEYTADLEPLVKSLSTRDCIILDEYNDVYPNRREMPTGMYANVIYVNKVAGMNAGLSIPDKVESVEELLDSATLNDDIYTVAIAEDNVDDTLSAMLDGALYSYENKQIHEDVAQKFVVIGKAMKAQNYDYTINLPFNDFRNNKLVYYVDDTTELANFRNYLQGYYQVLPLLNDGNMVISMTKHVGIAQDANGDGKKDANDENKQLVGMQFVQFMLSDYAQDVMHIQNKISLPINETTLNTYIKFNRDIAFMKDYFGHFKVMGEARHICYDFNVKIYENIMLKNEDYTLINQYMRAE